MSFRITNSVEAFRTSRQMRSSGARVATSAERIASGLRINRSGDDAASLTISQRFRSSALGSASAQRNAQAAISMVQVADGALQSVHDSLHRMRELATRAASDGLTSVERGAIDVELQALGQSIDRIGTDTEFNGHALFSAASAVPAPPVAPPGPPSPPPATPSTLDPSSELQVGMTISAGSGGGLRTAMVTAIDVSGAQAGDTYTFGTNGGNISLTRGSDGAVDTFVPPTIAALGTATVSFTSLGVSITLFSVTGMNASRQRQALAAAANDTIVTAPGAGPAPPPGPMPVPAPAATVAGSTINVGPGATDTVTVPFEVLSLEDLGLDDMLASFNLSHSAGDAGALGDAIEAAVTAVSDKRARLGALQNRFEHAASYLEDSQVQVAASDSRLADADIVAESISLTRSNIARLMSTGVLTQAQLSADRVLTLLHPVS